MQVKEEGPSHKELKAGLDDEQAVVFVADYLREIKKGGTKVKGPQNFVIIEGDFQFLEPEMLDKVIFFGVEDAVRLENRVYRDSKERKEDLIDSEENEEKIRQNSTLDNKRSFCLIHCRTEIRQI